MGWFSRKTEDNKWTEEEKDEDTFILDIFNSPESYEPSDDYYDRQVEQKDIEDATNRHNNNKSK